MRTVLALMMAAALTLIGAGVVSAHDDPPDASAQPAEAMKFFKQGEAYGKQKKWDLAVAAYQQAVKVNPGFVEAWNAMAHAYRKTSKLDKALEAYKQAVATKPDYAAAHEYLARTHLAMHNKDAAMREYEIVKRLDPKLAPELLKAIDANDPDLGDDD